MVLHCIVCKFHLHGLRNRAEIAPKIRLLTYVIYVLDLSFLCSSAAFYDPIELHPDEGFTKQRALVDVRHLNVTSTVVIIVHTPIYRVCANKKVYNNNICECALFVKFAKIIYRKHFATCSVYLNIIPVAILYTLLSISTSTVFIMD